MKIFNIISAISTLALSVNAGFWDNVNRTELYEMMEKSIPEMHISLPEQSWSEMVEKAQVVEQEEKSDIEVEANLKFVYEGNEEDYVINFKFGGKSTVTFTKPGYNIKIKGNGKSLHGTKNIRLRSDLRDPSSMRAKITTDIMQKSGLIATEVGYTELYINDEYMGFWVVSDSIKSKWIERKFGEKSENVKTLYQCRADYIRLDDGSAKEKCTNANDDFADYMEPFNNFVDQVNAAKSREDFEKFMDVDNFIKYIAWEWLMGSWDHFTGAFGHNIYWYQQPNGKWVIIPYDHDIELGQEQWTSYCKGIVPYCDYDDVDFANIPLTEYEMGHPIIKTLIHDDDTKFRELLGDIISKVFNPDTILIQIDKIKELISPYMKKDRETGAGRINKKGKDYTYKYEHFLGNADYMYCHDLIGWARSYGIKDWIRRRYIYAAAYYGINTNATSPEEKHKLIEPRPEPVILPYNVTVTSEEIEGFIYYTIQPPLPEYTPDKNYADDRVPVLGVNQYILEKKNEAKPVEPVEPVEPTESTESTESTEPTEPTEPTKPTVCWSESLGYKCCSKGCDAKVRLIDGSGYWGAENGEWCGIPDDCNFDNDECPGKKYGYPCCEKCKTFLTDNDGAWGVENHNWCSIKNSCN